MKNPMVLLGMKGCIRYLRPCGFGRCSLLLLVFFLLCLSRPGVGVHRHKDFAWKTRFLFLGVICLFARFLFCWTPHGDAVVTAAHLGHDLLQCVTPFPPVLPFPGGFCFVFFLFGLVVASVSRVAFYLRALGSGRLCIIHLASCFYCT